jgi:hypothetical protein
VTTRTILTDLMNEIDAVTEYHDPEEGIRPTDTVVMQEAPEDIKKVFTLQRKYARRAMAYEIQRIAGLKPEELLTERSVNFKAQVLTELMWQAISFQFPADKQELIGLRKGFVLVTPVLEAADLGLDMEQTAQESKLVN